MQANWAQPAGADSLASMMWVSTSVYFPHWEGMCRASIARHMSNGERYTDESPLCLLDIVDAAPLIPVVICTTAIMFSWFKEAFSPAAPLILDVVIDNKRTFTTLECFTGALTAKASVDTIFDRLDIRLIGTSRTYGRRVVPQAPNARTVTTAHRFLELNQPDLHLHFPENNILKAGCTYEFPFEFAIPHRMLPATCRHVVSSPCVHDLHTLMPPSFGDREFGSVFDYAPRRTSIKYRVVARIQKAADSGDYYDIGNCSERLRFVPSEALRVSRLEDWNPPRYGHEKISLRKLWNKPSGNLVVTSTRLSPFQVIDNHSSVWCGDLRGRAQINLEFHPTYEGAKPPTDINIEAILRTETVSAVVPLPQLPPDDSWSGPEIDRHSSPSVVLSCQAFEGIEWVPQAQGSVQRLDQCPAYEASECATGSPSNTCSTPYYSARIETTFSAKIGFSIAPTFHSCLISRMYRVEMRLGVRSSVLEYAPTVRLKLPVQVVREQAVIRGDRAVEEKNTVGCRGEPCSQGADLDRVATWEIFRGIDYLSSSPRYDS